MVAINWTVMGLLIIGLFALAGFIKGWLREAIVTLFLIILYFFLQAPAVARSFINAINAVIAFIWGILPTSVLNFLETMFGLGQAGAPPQIDAGSPQTWLIMLIIFIGLAIVVGRLWLPGAARNADRFSGYVVTCGGRIFGLLLGAVNAWLIITLVRGYLEGSNLPGGSTTTATLNDLTSMPANDSVMIQAVDVPAASIMDSFLPWFFAGLGVLVLIAAIKSRYGIHEEKGFRKMAYKAPLGYRKEKISSGG
jgi:hypothetical protein